ncbi:MAG: hypothetical protein K1X47_06940 [Cyclobacteriaceae bacterium]|nr:hypothetical protein [Cyclobacteriaceae bacterium]
MKSSNFVRNPSEIRMIKEPASRKRWNWDKLIYLTILFIAISIGFYYLLRNMLFVVESGQVQFQALEIQETRNVKLEKIFVAEGQRIDKGDTLFSYRIDLGNDDNTVRGDYVREQSIAASAARYRSDIEIKKAELNELKSMLEFTQKERKRIEQEVHLSIYPAEKLSPYIRSEEELRSRIILTEQEIGILERTLPAIGWGMNDLMLTPLKYFTSPISGTVAHLYMTDNETVLSTEEIMSVFLPHKNAFIKTFFLSEDMKYLKVGDRFDVTFPDGSKSVGIISKIYQDTYELPEHYKKFSEDVYDRIEADLEPANLADTVLWDRSVKLQVEITKFKYR